MLNLPLEEEVGLVGLHWGDRFLEFVPWSGQVCWEVEPWGSWSVFAENAEHRVSVEATCDRPGSPLRAPTANQGLSPFCRDSFYGKVDSCIKQGTQSQKVVWRKLARVETSTEVTMSCTMFHGAG